MEKFKVIGTRFLKAFLAGAFSSTALVAVALIKGVTTWAELGTNLNALAIVGIGGGLVGVLMAGDKWARWQD